MLTTFSPCSTVRPARKLFRKYERSRSALTPDGPVFAASRLRRFANVGHRIHLLFRDGLLPSSLVDQIYPLQLLRTIRKLVYHDLIHELGSREHEPLILRRGGSTNSLTRERL